MSILDGLAAGISDALSDVFHDGVLLVPGQRVRDGQGGWKAGEPIPYPCKALVDDYSDYRRAAVGIPANDRKILILGHGLTVEPRPGHTITAEGRDWQIVGVSRDPAGATWEVQGR